MSAGPRFANFYRVLDERREHGALANAIRWLAGVLLAALVTHTVLAVVLVDGPELLEETAETELGWVTDRDPAAAERLVGWVASGREWLLRRSGLGRLFTTGSSAVGSVARGAHRALGGLAASVQLLTIRLGVLAMSLPLIAFLLLVAMVEGWSNWYLRRRAGSRESSFLYHRFKKATKLVMIAFLLAYLVPPVALDPAWVFASFLLTLVVAFAMAVSLFKKHI